MKGNYNTVAPFYDGLSRLIFGDAIVKAQQFLVEAITPNSTILIVGGGTGWILEEISQLHPNGLTIVYVDISEKMIGMAKRKNAGGNLVTFVHASIQDALLTQMFNVVITPFLIDNFSIRTANLVFNKIDSHLRYNGLWLFADFRIGKKGVFWQRALLKVMYVFFKTVCNIEAGRLPDSDGLFQKNRYVNVASKSFFGDFICSIIYRKPNA